MSIEPKTLKGFRDFAPKDKIARDILIGKIKNTFELFGYLPLETPALEFKEILTGDYGEDEKLMYSFTDHGGREVAMRFDLTVPFARYVAGNKSLTLPFKRYQIAPVWRGENTQAGRYREFYQCDADIVGADQEKSDFEIISLAVKLLKELNVGNFKIKVNNRKLYTCLLDKIKVPEEIRNKFLQKADKLEKIGLDAVIEEIVSLGIDESSLEPLKNFLSLPKDWRQAKESLSGFGLCETGRKGFEELDSLFYAVKESGILENIIFDSSIVRGLGYYTGLVFETDLEELKEIGSILSGGRYDNLLSRFGDESLSAVGLSVGIDRLLTALQELGKIKKDQSVAKALIATASKECENYANKIASNLRESGINVETYLGANNDLGKQLKYASSLDIPFTIIIGEVEMQTDSATLKDLKTGDQETLSLEKLTSKLQIKE